MVYDAYLIFGSSSCDISLCMHLAIIDTQTQQEMQEPVEDAVFLVQ